MFLVIIPVVRGFFAALRGGFADWLSGAWLDILVVAVMITVAVLRWYRVTFMFDSEHLDISTGLLYRKSLLIPWNKIVTVSTCRMFFLRPIKAVLLRADTIGGTAKDSDFSILLKPKHADALMGHLDAPRNGYTPSTASIIGLALLTSNSFAGIVFVSTLISQAGKLFGQQVQDLFLGTMQSVARTLAFGVHPAAAMLAYLLLFGWLVGFWRTFVRHKNMTVSHVSDSLLITGGLFSYRQYRIEYNSIAYVDIRRSLLAHLLKLCSLSVSSAGFGKHKSDITCVIPTEHRSSFAKTLARMFPEFKPSPRQFYHSKGAVVRFVALPVCICIALGTGLWILLNLYPDWDRFTRFVGLMLLVPALVFLTVRILDFRTGGISFRDGCYTMHYTTPFNLHTVIIPAEAVVMTEVTQGFFQRFSGKCDILLYTKAEGRAPHRISSLNLEQVTELNRQVSIYKKLT